MATNRKHRGKHQVQVRRKGFPTISKSFNNLADAKEWARHMERQADRGELGPDRKVLDTITLAELLSRYLDEVIPKKRHGETDTFALNLVLRHSISQKRLSDLSHIDFTGYRDERLKKVSPAMLKRQLTPLRHMFRHAHDEWDIPLRDNPLSKIKLFKADKKRVRAAFAERRTGPAFQGGRKDTKSVHSSRCPLRARNRHASRRNPCPSCSRCGHRALHGNHPHVEERTFENDPAVNAGGCDP